MSELAKNFLVELGTEDLPPKQLKNIIHDFKLSFAEQLDKNNLSFSSIEEFATPRRLALLVKGLPTKQDDKVIEKKGPSVIASYDADGNLTKAAQGWLNGNGITIDQTYKSVIGNGEFLVYKTEVIGENTENLLFALVDNAIKSLSFPRAMRWANNDFTFIRPVHTLTLLFADKIIAGKLFGIESSNLIRGHRFLGQSEFTINQADDYEKLLKEKGEVIASFNNRRAIIVEQVQNKAAQLGGVVKLDDDLLDEVTSLVENPNVLVASFEDSFLLVPKEALVYTMEGDQKYFPLYDNNGNLLPKFIFVSNIHPLDPSLIISGNEKVVRPRLSDAKFFFEQDLKTPLIDLLPRLETVVFQKELGTIKDKIDRIVILSDYLANKLSIDSTNVKRASLLSKCDLMTNMVFEFTDTQGIMGMYYARYFGENEEVSLALREQYLPRFSGDELPTTNAGSLLSLADKIDTITGIFAIKQAPKGAKDPFALRRLSIGVLRILTENKINIDLAELVEYSLNNLANRLSLTQDAIQKVKLEVLDFISNRLRGIYEEKGYSIDEILSIQVLDLNNYQDFEARINAVKEFKKSSNIYSLVESNKRVGQIISKSNLNIDNDFNINLCIEESEKKLANEILVAKEQVNKLLQKSDFIAILQYLSKLDKIIEDFFDNVMVNVEDNVIRENRIAILKTLSKLFLTVADIRQLHVIKITD